MVNDFSNISYVKADLYTSFSNLLKNIERYHIFITFQYMLILYFTFLFSLFVFVSTAGQYFSILTGHDQYNVFLRILSELVFCLRCTITKNMSSDRFASIEYNITNSSWHFGPNGSLWTGLSPTK